jgi:hypothetical protein
MSRPIIHLLYTSELVQRNNSIHYNDRTVKKGEFRFSLLSTADSKGDKTLERDILSVHHIFYNHA